MMSALFKTRPARLLLLLLAVALFLAIPVARHSGGSSNNPAPPAALAAGPAVDTSVCVQLQGYRDPGEEPTVTWELRTMSSGPVHYSSSATITVDNGCFTATGVSNQFYWLTVYSADSLPMQRQLQTPWPNDGSPVDLRVAAVGEANALWLREGDLNQDGAIDAADATLFGTAFATNHTDGDLDENGTVDFLDVALFAPNFGGNGPSGVKATPPVGSYTLSTNPSGPVCPTDTLANRTVRLTMAVNTAGELTASAQLRLALTNGVAAVNPATAPFTTQYRSQYNSGTGQYDYVAALHGGNVGSSFSLGFDLVVDPSATWPGTVTVSSVNGSTVGNATGTQFGNTWFQQLFVTGNSVEIALDCPQEPTPTPTPTATATPTPTATATPTPTATATPTPTTTPEPESDLMLYLPLVVR
jgi:hypothetical protein